MDMSEEAVGRLRRVGTHESCSRRSAQLGEHGTRLRSVRRAIQPNDATGDFARPQAFSDSHGATAERAAPWLLRWHTARWGACERRIGEQLTADRKQAGAASVGKKPEMTDAHEATWQDVQEKAT